MLFERQFMMNWLKNNTIQMILVIWLKNLNITEIEEIEKKIPNHNKYITTAEFIKLTNENFSERLKQVNLAT